ncbi:ELC-like protein [Tanacetum coccineum]|uniref:ELC-like protein n=1 Tax=Tanacetum coccineum TaxID=301880 RepID=A0ABQ5G7E6_9ASTR
MASTSQVEIIDNAMFCDSVYALAYSDSDQKLLIRQHLHSLHREYPSLCPVIDTFIHNDGTMVTLLKVEGCLHVSRSLPLVHINIWIHEHYPNMAPIVQVTLDPANPIRPNHPFVDLSGVTNSSYLQTWDPFGYDLLGLVYNLVKIFTLDHPFYVVNVPSSSHPSYMSKMECMDHLWCRLHYDMIALREYTNDEVEKLSILQEEMKTRVNITGDIISGLYREKADLKQNVEELTDEADMLINWLMVNKVNLSIAMGGNAEDAFECANEDSQLVMDLLAEDKALEDVMYALDKALQNGAVSYEAYLKQVRSLARDQFFVRAKLKKLKGPHIFKFL